MSFGESKKQLCMLYPFLIPKPVHLYLIAMDRCFVVVIFSFFKPTLYWSSNLILSFKKNGGQDSLSRLLGETKLQSSSFLQANHKTNENKIKFKFTEH